MFIKYSSAAGRFKSNESTYVLASECFLEPIDAPKNIGLPPLSAECTGAVRRLGISFDDSVVCIRGVEEVMRKMC